MVVGATSNHHEWTPADQKEGSLDGAGVALDWGGTRAREAPEPTVPTAPCNVFCPKTIIYAILCARLAQAG